LLFNWGSHCRGRRRNHFHSLRSFHQGLEARRGRAPVAGLFDEAIVFVWSQYSIGMDPAEAPSDTMIDLINSRFAPVSDQEANVIPLLAFQLGPGAYIIGVSLARTVNSSALVLTDDEMPNLGILNVCPDAGDTCPSMDGSFVI
jgi:hypothetical protein